MSQVDGPGACVLLVDSDEASRSALAQALHGYDTLIATNSEDALRHLGATKVSAVIVNQRLTDTSGISLLRRIREGWPACGRILAVSYDDLPAVVRDERDGLLQRVLPNPTQPENVQRAVERVLAPDDITAQIERPQHAIDAVFDWTARRLAKIPGIVVRRLPTDKKDLQMQFVLPAGTGLDALRLDLVSMWGLPLKPSGAQLPKRRADHPVLRLFGRMELEQEAYALPIFGRGHAYLAVLPWRREPKVTLALGLLVDDGDGSERALLERTHQTVVMSVREFVVPALAMPTDTSPIALLEYDWVVTKNYVGPDRRRTPTPLWSRFFLFGRRRHVPRTLRAAPNTFVDRLGRTGIVFALAYLTLSAIDTACTWRFVGSGKFSELNPLLRPLLLHPWAFLVVKNALTVASLLIVVRYELTRVGPYVFGAALSVYAALDLYWLFLLTR